MARGRWSSDRQPHPLVDNNNNGREATGSVLNSEGASSCSSGSRT
jgi:hypothetical protein